MQAHQHEEGDRAAHCQHCLVHPSRSQSSLVAWIVAAVAVAFALIVFFSRSGWGIAAGYGSFALLGVLVCPLVMGAMMFFMMRKH
jgi:hypothetical protein